MLKTTRGTARYQGLVWPKYMRRRYPAPAGSPPRPGALRGAMAPLLLPARMVARVPRRRAQPSDQLLALT
jgi:hypothetical protein